MKFVKCDYCHGSGRRERKLMDNCPTGEIIPCYRCQGAGGFWKEGTQPMELGEFLKKVAGALFISVCLGLPAISVLTFFWTENLLEKIDLKNDTLQGDWSLQEGALIAPNSEYASLRLSPDPLTDYHLIFTVERKEGEGPLVLGLVGDESSRFAAVLNDRGPRLVETNPNPDSRPEDEQDEEEPLFPLGESVRLILIVESDPPSVSVQQGFSSLVQWEGEFRELTVPKDWPVEDTKGFFIGSHNSRFRVTQLDYIDYTWGDWPFTAILTVFFIGIFILLLRAP